MPFAAPSTCSTAAAAALAHNRVRFGRPLGLSVSWTCQGVRLLPPISSCSRLYWQDLLPATVFSPGSPWSSHHVACGPMANVSNSREAPRPKNFQLARAWLAVPPPHRLCAPTAQSFAPFSAPKSPKRMPSRQRLCRADPTRVFACRHPHDVLPEWCNHSSKDLARPSVEWCSSDHASDANWVLLPRVEQSTPACRDSRALPGLTLSAAHNEGFGSWPSPPSRLLQPNRFQEIGISTTVLGWARTLHLPSSWSTVWRDWPSHELSLVPSSHELFAETATFLPPPLLYTSREFRPHKTGELLLTPSGGSPLSSATTTTSPAFIADRLHKYP